MLHIRRRVVSPVVGLLTVVAGLAVGGSALGRASSAGDPDTAHVANPNRVIATVNGSTHQVQVNAVRNGGAPLAVHADGGGPNGGSGLGGGKRKRSTGKGRRVKSAGNPTAGNDPILAPVAQDGGSSHLGERTLKMGMHGHDVRVLQSYLTIAGFSTTIDGQFGKTTQRNAMSFESSHQLTANGVVTYPQTRMLRQVVATDLAGGAVTKATINGDGSATAPAGAPAVVQQVIAAANQIDDTPYVWGGGHARFNDTGYDCSGSVSYALHGGGLLSSPEDSSELMNYGSAGPGQWITIYANPSHTWIVVAGIAFDTAHFGSFAPAGTGPRWFADPTGNLADGGHYVVRHPAGL